MKLQLARNWSDQPEIVERAPVLVIMATDAGLFEVRKDPSGVYYFTGGNLFGSQTIECATADDVFRLMNLATNRKGKKPMKAPDGMKIVE